MYDQIQTYAWMISLTRQITDWCSDSTMSSGEMLLFEKAYFINNGGSLAIFSLKHQLLDPGKRKKTHKSKIIDCHKTPQSLRIKVDTWVKHWTQNYNATVVHITDVPLVKTYFEQYSLSTLHCTVRLKVLQ